MIWNRGGRIAVNFQKMKPKRTPAAAMMTPSMAAEKIRCPDASLFLVVGQTQS
jgi:hypothetical protein